MKNIDYAADVSIHDLKQMYVYHEFFIAEKVALLYPGENENSRTGNYFNKFGVHGDSKQCSVIIIKVGESIKKWQLKIQEQINDFIK